MKVTTSQLAIVILNWNGKALLQQFLPAVLEFSEEAKIYVIDNASTDDSINWLKKQYSQISVIPLANNFGYAGGYQKGLKQINEPYYCLLNSDVEVTKNWLPPILELFEDNTISAIQPKILDYSNKEYFEYAGAGGGLIDGLGYPYCRGRVFDSIEKDNGQYNDTAEIFWASGACFFIRSADFWNVGGLDSDYFAHQEEIDLCWRLHNHGKKIMYYGTSTIYHVGGASLAYVSPQKTFFNFRNSLYSILKNVKGTKVFGVLFLRMILDGLAGVQFLIQIKPKHFFSILRAHFSFYKNLPSTLKKRKNISKKEIHYNTKSIVMDYFVFKKYKN